MALRIGERPFLFWCGLVLRGSRTVPVRAIPRAPRKAGLGSLQGPWAQSKGPHPNLIFQELPLQFLRRKLRDGWHLFNHLLSPRIPERSRRVRLSKTGMVLHPPPSFQKKQKKSKNSQKKRRICLTLFRFACIFSFTVATTGLTKSQPLFDRNSEGKQRQNFICQQKESVKFFNRPENQF